MWYHTWLGQTGGHFDFCQNDGPLGGATLGARQKSKQYAIVDICANFRAFGRSWTKRPIYCPKVPDYQWLCEILWIVCLCVWYLVVLCVIAPSFQTYIPFVLFYNHYDKSALHVFEPFLFHCRVSRWWYMSFLQFFSKAAVVDVPSPNELFNEVTGLGLTDEGLDLLMQVRRVQLSCRCFGERGFNFLHFHHRLHFPHPPTNFILIIITSIAGSHRRWPTSSPAVY